MRRPRAASSTSQTFGPHVSGTAVQANIGPNQKTSRRHQSQNPGISILRYRGSVIIAFGPSGNGQRKKPGTVYRTLSLIAAEEYQPDRDRVGHRRGNF